MQMDATPSQGPALFDLSGRVVVVTGGYGQLGRCFAVGLAGLGARVAVLDLGADAGRDRAAFGAAAEAGTVRGFSADVTDRASLEAAADKVVAAFGAPFGLVNNAALDSAPDADASQNGPFEAFPAEAFAQVMAVNVGGVFQASQVFGALMAEAGGGSIVNVASIYGQVSPDQSLYEYRRQDGEDFYKPVAYAASKSALYNLTRYVAGYWGPRNVRCNTVTFAGVFNNQDPRFLAGYRRKIPLDRGEGFQHLHGMARPEDYLGPVAFLMSPAASYMTGADLRVDGGYLAL